MKTTKDLLQEKEGGIPNSTSSPSIISVNVTDKSEVPRDPVNISNAAGEGPVPLETHGGSFMMDLEVKSNTIPNTESTGNSPSTFSGVAFVNRTVQSLNSMQRAAKRGAARKKKGYHKDDDTCFAGYSAMSQDTVATNDTSYTYPGAVSVSGIGSSPHNDSIDEALEDHEQEHQRGAGDHPDGRRRTHIEHGGTEDPHNITPSLIVTARLVSENPLMPEFLEEHLERRIQEGVESRLREQQTEHHQQADPPQPPIITTVVAEPMDQANDISHVASKLNPANPRTPSGKVWGVLVGLVAMVVGGLVTGVILAGNNESIQATKTTPPTQETTNSKLFVRLEPWIVRSDNDQDAPLFQDPASPQAQALDWLSYDDANLSQDRQTATVLQRYVLAVLYFSTNGPFWVTQDYGFLSNADVCSWNNDTSWGDPSPRGIFCGNSSSVEYILLANEDLRGTIPWELSLLSGLLGLNLSNNKLRSSIPTELGHLTALQELWLYVNDLTGTMPTELGRLSAMSLMSLFSNSFTGTLPTELGQLTYLVAFYVPNNNLQGTIPIELMKLTNLVELGFDGNELTGTLPTELANLSALTWLSVSTNSLTGTLPIELGQLSKLAYFDGTNNELTGTLPTELGQLTGLEQLYLSNNTLTGTLPTELGQLIKLFDVYIMDNKLNGTLPHDLMKLTDLVRLVLDDNDLMGTFPTELATLTALTVLSFTSNSFTGTLPTELGLLTNLIGIFVENNNFNGTVPTELGHLTFLTTVFIQANALTGTLPAEFGQLTSLLELHAEMNGFIGSIPMTLSALSNLNKALFHQNELTGSVNEIFCANARQWEKLQSDCLASYGQSEIDCDCCTICCNADGTDCQQPFL